MDLRLGDLGEHGLEAFTAELSTREKTSWTFGLAALSIALFVFIEPLAAAVVMATGLWVIWNRNNRITKVEKKIFLTSVDVVLFLALVDKASVFFNAAGILALLVLIHLVYVWRR